MQMQTFLIKRVSRKILTNIEVSSLLNMKQEHSPLSDIQEKTLNYLNSDAGGVPKHISIQSVKSMVQQLQKYHISKVELFQIANLMPTSPVELNLIMGVTNLEKEKKVIEIVKGTISD